jgi:hypothetical protein
MRPEPPIPEARVADWRCTDAPMGTAAAARILEERVAEWQCSDARATDTDISEERVAYWQSSGARAMDTDPPIPQERVADWLPVAPVLPQPIVMGLPMQDTTQAAHGARQLPVELRGSGGASSQVRTRARGVQCVLGCACRTVHTPHACSVQVREVPTSISFEGCGAAISYHLAAYEAACRVYGRQELQAKKVKFVGTSSGSIAALIAALGLDAAFWKGMPVFVSPERGWCPAAAHAYHTRTRAHAHTRTRAHARTYTHTHTHTSRSAATAVGTDGQKMRGFAAGGLLRWAGPRRNPRLLRWPRTCICMYIGPEPAYVWI